MVNLSENLSYARIRVRTHGPFGESEFLFLPHLDHSVTNAHCACPDQLKTALRIHLCVIYIDRLYVNSNLKF